MNLNQQQDKFSELQSRANRANEQAIQINTKIEAAREQFDKLCAMALEKYGTKDIEELKLLLKKLEDENISKLQQFESDVVSLEKEVEEKNALIRKIQSNNSL